MDAYIYRSDILCKYCGEGVREKINAIGKGPPFPNDESTYDSDEYPKGPYADGGGEADAPQYCAKCKEPLDNPVIPDSKGNTMEVTTEAFMAWLAKQNPEDRVDPWDATDCIGYRFLKDSGFPVGKCWIRWWNDESGMDHDLPVEIGNVIDWATDQVAPYSDRGISFKQLQEHFLVTAN